MALLDLLGYLDLFYFQQDTKGFISGYSSEVSYSNVKSTIDLKCYGMSCMWDSIGADFTQISVIDQYISWNKNLY